MNIINQKLMQHRKGFTLIELLIVVVIIVVLAAGAFVALDPATRFADSRDATRWTDVTAVLDAAKVDQVDNGGVYLDGTGITLLNDGSSYMIGTDGPSASETCTGGAVVANATTNLTGLVTGGYLASVPIAPTAAGGSTWDAGETGYYLTKAGTGTLTVGACDAESTTSISVSR